MPCLLGAGCCSQQHHTSPLPPKVSAGCMSCWKCPPTWREAAALKMPVFCAPCPAIHCHLHDGMDLGIRREKPWVIPACHCRDHTDNEPLLPSAVNSQQWKHHRWQAWLYPRLGARQPTSTAHQDPVTTNSGAHGSWGSQNRNIPLWEHIIHLS